MKIKTLEINNQKIKAVFLFFNKQIESFSYNTKFVSTGKAADIFLSENVLIKLERTKYSFNTNPIKWINREFIKKISLINMSMLREASGYKKLKKLGIKTPELYGYGFFFSLSFRYSSFLLIENKVNFIVLHDYLLSADYKTKEYIYNKIKNDLYLISKQGFYHRDLHTGNFLIDPKSKDICWIDIHLKKIKSSKVKNQSLNDFKQLIFSPTND